MLEFFLSKDTNAIDLMALNRKREQLPFTHKNQAARRKMVQQYKIQIDSIETYGMGFEWEQ